MLYVFDVKHSRGEGLSNVCETVAVHGPSDATLDCLLGPLLEKSPPVVDTPTAVLGFGRITGPQPLHQSIAEVQDKWIVVGKA
jgi:hypothetical protein